MFVELLRICRATSKFQVFIKSATVSIERIVKQEGLINHLKKTLLKLFNGHKKCLITYRKTNDYVLNKL